MVAKATTGLGFTLPPVDQLIATVKPYAEQSQDAEAVAGQKSKTDQLIVRAVSRKWRKNRMSPKCPNCGYEPPKGRPKKLDDKKVKAERKKGKSLANLAKQFSVTRGAIQAALKR